MSSTMLPFKMITGIIFFVLAATTDIGAEDKWVKLRTESGETIRAIYGVPGKEGKYPAVIYHHGTFVRKLGYQEALDRGYDVKDFVEALVETGFIGLAPIRMHGRVPARAGDRALRKGGSPRQWSDAIKEGLRVTNSAIEFLKQQPNVNAKRIGIIGFSEGGVVTLWSAFNRKELRAVVLMSPANIGKSDEFRFNKAVKKLEAINAPVFLTLGRSDVRKIIDNCTKRFIPRMNQLNKHIEYKMDYPGDHRWFWKVRAEYWKDIIGFLKKHLT